MFLLQNLTLLCQKVLGLLYAIFYYENSKKQVFQQIANNHSSNTDFDDFMNLYKKCTAKPYLFLITDATLASDSSSRLRKNLLERI